MGRVGGELGGIAPDLMRTTGKQLGHLSDGSVAFSGRRPDPDRIGRCRLGYRSEIPARDPQSVNASRF